MREIRSERFRHKLLTLLDGRQDIFHHVYHLNYMVHGEKLADWLLIRGLKGENLASWLSTKHENSFLKAVAFIIADINKTNSVRPIIVGKDYGRATG